MSTPKQPSAPVPTVPPVSELPVTRSMLMGVRDELRARIDGTNARIDGLSARIDGLSARIDETNARVDGLSARIDGLSARIDETNARIDGLSARIDETNARVEASRCEVLAEIHRIGTLVEDQEARNRVVIEAVQGHNARFERLEAGLDDVRGMIREILDAVRQRPQP